MGLAPVRLRSSRKPVDSVYLKECRGGFATQRGQAPSPQNLFTAEIVFQVLGMSAPGT